MKKIIIELPDNGGYSIKGTDELEDRSECVWAILGARRAEEIAIEKGYLHEIRNGIEHRFDTVKSKIQLLVDEDREREKATAGAPVSPTYIQIELPSNVPSKIKPIVILPDEECTSIDVKVSQNGKNYASFELVTKLDEAQIINLNTGSVNR